MYLCLGAIRTNFKFSTIYTNLPNVIFFLKQNSQQRYLEKNAALAMGHCRLFMFTIYFPYRWTRMTSDMCSIHSHVHIQVALAEAIVHRRNNYEMDFPVIVPFLFNISYFFLACSRAHAMIRRNSQFICMCMLLHTYLFVCI